MRLKVAGSLLWILLGCGGATQVPSPDGGAGSDGGGPQGIPAGPGKATLTGSQSFSVGSARAMTDYGRAADGGLDFGRIEVDVSNRAAEVCARTPMPPAEVLTIYLVKSDADRQAGVVFEPGTYSVTPFTIGSSGMVSVLRSRFDAFNDILGMSTGGTVTLTTRHASGIAGSFAVNLRVKDGGPETLSGSFEAPACP